MLSGKAYGQQPEECVIQEFPYTQDFSVADGCMTAEDLNVDGEVWTQYPSYGYEDSPMMALNTQGGANDLLYTPYIATAGGYTVTWKAMSWWAEYGIAERYTVKLVHADGSADSLFGESLSATGFVDRIAGFNVAAGANDRIAIHVTTSAGGFFVLDNLVITYTGEQPMTNYTLTVESNNEAWGSVEGGGTYPEGSTATLTATAAAGYRFAHWNDGSTDNPREVTVTADTTYTAHFEANPIGDTLGWCVDAAGVSSLTMPNEFYWGIRIPAGWLAGREYISEVMIYNRHENPYILYIYKGDDAPTTLLHTQPCVPADTGWQAFGLDHTVNIDAEQDLWVLVYSRHAAYCDHDGGTNGALISTDGEAWNDLPSMGYEYTWMLRCVTVTLHPPVAPPTVVISGPSYVDLSSSVTYKALATTGTTVQWTFLGILPSTATGDSVILTWPSVGTYTVTAAVNNIYGLGITHKDVVVVDCDAAVAEYPYSHTIDLTPEDRSSLSCWHFVDADGDGFGWSVDGSGRAMSESWRRLGGALTPDNWMVTHKFQLRDNYSYTLNWEESSLDANYFREHYGLYVALVDAGYDIDSYTLLQDYTLASAGPTTRTVDLSAYAGQTIRLAFRHWNCTNENTLAIGNITIAGQENPVGIDEAGTVLSAPLSAALLDITGRVLYEVNAPAPGYRFDTSRLPSGTYLVRVVTAEGIAVRKLTVVR